MTIYKTENMSRKFPFFSRAVDLKFHMGTNIIHKGFIDTTVADIERSYHLNLFVVCPPNACLSDNDRQTFNN